MIRIFSIFMLLWAWLCANAQNIIVEDFRQLHKLPIVQNDKFATDKHNAIVDFITSAKGMQFWADGKTQGTATDIDGGISVMVPSGTSYIKISHPQYGTLLWKVPGKRLKGNRRYQATLTAYDPDEDFKPQRQWLVFDISPRDAILQVDTASYVLRQGYKELELPIGMHGYSIIAPFHDTVADSILLQEDHSERIEISLQPQFSYLTVESPLPHAQIYVDNQQIGVGHATSQRLQAGLHDVRLVLNGIVFYDESISIRAADKPTLTIAMDQLSPHFDSNGLPIAASSNTAAAKDATAPDYQAQMAIPTGFLSISCDATDARVYIDGKAAGQAPLIVGQLSTKRSHEVRVKKDGYADAVKIVTPVTNELTEVKLTLKRKK